MVKKTIGEKIRDAVKKTGLTQQEFCKRIGIGESVISRWLKGNRNPSITSLKKIADATNTPLNYFLGIEEIDTKTIQPLNESTTIKLPILTSVICGKPDYCTIDEQVIDDFAEVPKTLFPDGNFIVRCQGDSMLPEIPPRAYCIIKKTNIPLNNKNMLIKTSDGFTIKRVKIVEGKVNLFYLNPTGKELIVNGTIEIIGKVIGIYQRY